MFITYTNIFVSVPLISSPVVMVRERVLYIVRNYVRSSTVDEIQINIYFFLISFYLMLITPAAIDSISKSRLKKKISSRKDLGHVHVGL